MNANLTVYDENRNKLFDYDLNNINNIKIIDIFTRLKTNYNLDNCIIISKPELYIYSYELNNFDNYYTYRNLINLFEDYLINDTFFSIYIIPNVLKPPDFGAIQITDNNKNSNLQDYYLITKCCKRLYNFDGKILNYNYNKDIYNFITLDELDNINKQYFINIRYIYIFELELQYNIYKNYITKLL